MQLPDRRLVVIAALPRTALERRLDPIRRLPLPRACLVRMQPVALRDPLDRVDLLQRFKRNARLGNLSENWGASQS